MITDRMINDLVIDWKMLTLRKVDISQVQEFNQKWADKLNREVKSKVLEEIRDLESQVIQSDADRKALIEATVKETVKRLKPEMQSHAKD